MCVPPDAQPPIQPDAAAVTRRSDLVLTASDGNEFAAFEALAADSDGPAVVVLPDVRGLFRFYEELAIRFAERGYDSIAIDYFGRTAGVSKRPNEWDFRPHVEQVTNAGLGADVAAAVTRLRAADPERAVFTVGFCFGGSNSWHQAANGHGLSGAIGFYGRPTTPDRPLGAASIIDRIDQFECPVLALMAGDDHSIPPGVVAEFRAALTTAGAGELVVYDGAPHSFFDRTYRDHADASADAWSRVLAFIESSAD